MFKLEEATIDSIQAAVAAKEISYKELVLLYLERIAKVDTCEGGLNSVLEINPDVLETARAADEDRAKGFFRGSLHGIPVMVKDNINTGDRMHTSAGSLALADNYAFGDAEIVRSLRENGALILGKVNMTEFANWMSQGMPNGYSSRGGQVYNPYNREADPYGSSTGSAVAVAANLCAASIGTETHGSITVPAYVNGVVGIKPTAGLLSGHGIIPISSTLDTPGPMARTVKDAAIMLGGLKSMYPLYNYSGWLASGHMPTTMETQKKDYTAGLDEASLRGLRIGIYGYEYQDDELKTVLEEAFGSLESEGAVFTKNIKRVCEGRPWDYMGRAIAVNEFKSAINFFLAGTGYMPQSRGQNKSLKEIIEFNEANSEACLKYGQTLLLECQNETSGNLTEAAYIEALRRRETAIKDMDKIFASNNLDVLVCKREFDGIGPIAGFPAGSLPIGFRKNGVPMGMHFIARRFDESMLLKAMYAVEKLIGKRKPPFE